MNTNKIESAHFKAFRKLVSDFPIGEVWHEDCPDFWIHTESGVIGVEHCLVHIPSALDTPPQAIENYIDEIISIAQEHAELRGIPPIQAIFSFKKFARLEKKKRIELARTITNIIHDKLPPIDGTEPYTQILIRQPELPEQLSSIQISRLKQSPNHFWRCARAGWVMENCIELFQKSIDNKTKLYSKYIGNCSECWLLMVAEMKPSSFIHPNQESIDHAYNFPFKRTYFFDLSRQSLHLLKKL